MFYTPILVESKFCIDAFWPNVTAYDNYSGYHPFTIGLDNLQKMRTYIDYVDKVIYISIRDAR